ncbi:MAG: transcription-repair coupling factor [Dehalococcoidia bacterium]|nr:transcription-repair coupling factor [Dehalococcoidia bacterium]
MDLSGLLSLVEQVTGYQRLRSELIEPRGDGVKLIASDAVKPFVIAALHQEMNLPILVVMAQPESARRLYDELQSWCPSSTMLQFFPEIDIMAGEYSESDVFVSAERLRTLSALTSCRDLSADGRSPLIVSSALAAVSRTVPRDEFIVSCHDLRVGMDIDPFQLVARWQAMGYELENIVEVPGTISRRGGIVDVFSPDSEFPARIEFVGNQVESIRLFDSKTQHSLKPVNSVTIAPARESRHRLNRDTILDYLSEKTLLITDDLYELKIVIDKLIDEAKELSHVESEQGEPAPDLPIVSWSEFEKKTRKVKQRLTFCLWSADDCDKSHLLPLAPVPGYGGRLEVFSKGLEEMLQEGRRIIVVSQQANRLAELLQEKEVLVSPVSQIEQVPSLKSVTLVQGALAEGWTIRDVMTLFTDNEIFGFVKQRRSSRKKPVRYHWFISELTPGDYVVHIEHGIARFSGLTKMLADGIEREYLVLKYAASDRLYVPVDQVDRVSRYVGASDQSPTLSRLGTQEWARIKQRIKQSVANVARELLGLYSTREVITGFAFSPDNLWQQELESSFPYMETLDQLEAVLAVKGDMEKPKPMDRLVCGDVGYGKTEVALRAAFKSVMDGKQVALLVPTTVLAQQHFATFRDRLQAFPVRVEVLSRFCTEREQSDIIEGLAAGTVDICIGTHRLLQKDVVFKDLGLIIIDEEQRFGVVHKEHFKKLRREIDVLTLSATPIPRTLHMSLAGIRDMSTIETPPEERLPIKTYVGVYDERIVREAILRELERNGQVFFVHNRVHSIAMVADRLGRLVPESRISVAHGRMPEEELEKVMADFVNHKSDILVTTTIIESGLDIPNVNTLIIDHADRLGLTQLYQLRGRIGRGSNNAYAYFFFEKGKQLTHEARKRLRTISEAAELGAGFAIAMKDLEIRGAGNLLGVEQSGYIAAVGFDLYCRLLAESVEDLRQERETGEELRTRQPSAPTIALPLAAYIPEEYISDLNTRLSFYQRLAAAKRTQEIKDLETDMDDRFGPIPQPVRNLLYIVEVKQLADAAMVESVSTEDRQIVLNFNSSREIKKLSLAQDFKSGIKAGSQHIKLDIKILGNDWQEVLKEVLQKVAKDVQS